MYEFSRCILFSKMAFQFSLCEICIFRWSKNPKHFSWSTWTDFKPSLVADLLFISPVLVLHISANNSSNISLLYENVLKIFFLYIKIKWQKKTYFSLFSKWNLTLLKEDSDYLPNSIFSATDVSPGATGQLLPHNNENKIVLARLIYSF